MVFELLFTASLERLAQIRPREYHVIVGVVAFCETITAELEVTLIMSRVNYRQDMPPKGGYEAFRFSRHLPKRGPNGTAIMLGGVAVMAFGFYVIKKTNEERRWYSCIENLVHYTSQACSLDYPS